MKLLKRSLDFLSTFSSSSSLSNSDKADVFSVTSAPELVVSSDSPSCTSSRRSSASSIVSAYIRSKLSVVPAPLEHHASLADSLKSMTHSEFMTLERMRNTAISDQILSRHLSETSVSSSSVKSRQVSDMEDFVLGKCVVSIKSEPLHIQYEVKGCITMQNYGFLLQAERVDLKRNRRRHVVLKFVDRSSAAYNAIKMNVNPEHTELALMLNGKGKHLPAYIAHEFQEDYLVIVAKSRGLRKKYGFGQRHKVNWLFFSSQTA